MELKLDRKASRGFVIALFSVIIGYMLLKETERVKMVWNFVSNIFSPFVLGALLAFILNVPMRFFESRLKKIQNEKVRRVSAIILMALVIALLIAGMILLLVLVYLDLGGSYLSNAIAAVYYRMIGLFF